MITGKVLITGATGLLGYNAALEFCKLGFDVRVFLRRNADSERLHAVLCEMYYGTIESAADVAAAVTGCDYVVHAASLTDQWGVAAAAYNAVNIKGTDNVIAACLKNKVKMLVYISTANTIAPGSRQHPGTELNAFTLFNVNSPYINTKYIAQQKVLEAAAERGLRAVVLNPAFIIGPNDFKPSSGKIFQYIIGRSVQFCPPGGKNFVYVNDVCRAIIAACATPARSTCMLVAGENLSYREFFALVNRIKKQRPLMIVIPGIVLKLAGLTGTFMGSIFRKRYRLNYTAAHLLCMDNYYSGKKASETLGFTYTPVTTAVEEAVAWFEKSKRH